MELLFFGDLVRLKHPTSRMVTLFGDRSSSVSKIVIFKARILFRIFFSSGNWSTVGDVEESFASVDRIWYFPIGCLFRLRNVTWKRLTLLGRGICNWTRSTMVTFSFNGRIMTIGVEAVGGEKSIPFSSGFNAESDPMIAVDNSGLERNLSLIRAVTDLHVGCVPFWLDLTPVRRGTIVVKTSVLEDVGGVVVDSLSKAGVVVAKREDYAISDGLARLRKLRVLGSICVMIDYLNSLDGFHLLPSSNVECHRTEAFGSNTCHPNMYTHPFDSSRYSCTRPFRRCNRGFHRRHVSNRGIGTCEHRRTAKCTCMTNSSAHQIRHYNPYDHHTVVRWVDTGSCRDSESNVHWKHRIDSTLQRRQRQAMHPLG